MALIECPECKTQVSDQANSCTGCGYPIGIKKQTFRKLSKEEWRHLKDFDKEYKMVMSPPNDDHIRKYYFECYSCYAAYVADPCVNCGDSHYYLKSKVIKLKYRDDYQQLLVCHKCGFTVRLNYVSCPDCKSTQTTFYFKQKKLLSKIFG